MNRCEYRKSWKVGSLGLNVSKSMDKNERTKLEQQIALNEEKQSQYIMRASKTIISILHKGFDKIKEDGRVIV